MLIMMDAALVLWMSNLNDERGVQTQTAVKTLKSID